MASGSTSVVIAALIGNALIMALKLVVAILTKSSAMAAEAIHSLADMGNQALLLLGIKMSRKPADKGHPFGHGKEQYFWSFLVANILFVLGAVFSIYEGTEKLLHPQPVERFYLIYIILGISLLIEGGSFAVAIRELIRQNRGKGILQELMTSKDSNLLVVLLEDSAAVTGLAIALAGTAAVQVTGNVAIDGIASITIGILLGVVAVFLANKMRNLLVGEGASSSVLRKVRLLADESPHVEGVGEIYTMHVGPDKIILAMTVNFNDNISAAAVESVTENLGKQIRSALPEILHVFIEPRQMTVET